MSHLRYMPPSRWRVDQWRKQIEEAACGGVENVWPRLSVVIKDMRKALDMDSPENTDFCAVAGCTYSASEGSAYCTLHGVRWNRGGPEPVDGD